MLPMHYQYREEDDDDELTNPSARKTVQSPARTSREEDSRPEQRTTKRAGKISRRKSRDH